MTKINSDFIKTIPKTDLHCHLDGSLRLSTLIELAKEQNIMLPAQTEEELSKLVFKDTYQDLVEYLRGFQYTVAVMQTPEAIERIAYELGLDAYAEGVCYLEVRFAPQLHVNANLDLLAVLTSVHNGLNKAKKEINRQEEIKKGDKPGFEFGIIGCALRMFKKSYSPYYRSLFNLHPDMPDEERFGLASLDLVRALIKARNDCGLAIVGVDLAGAEKGYPAEAHRHAYELAHKHFFKKTVHAGEAYGPASIFQAITDCHTDRIGHGTHLFNYNMVDLPDVNERKKYVQALAQYIADRRITIEICLTSNRQTIPALKEPSAHPFKQMLEARISTTFCTDNRLISRTTISQEVELALKNFEISLSTLKDIIIYGFKRSFHPGNYSEKREYVRQVIDYYEAVEQKFGL
ncbi:MAG: adenosine deaminase family protein [Pseudomonadota bacterium]